MTRFRSRPGLLAACAAVLCAVAGISFGVEVPLTVERNGDLPALKAWHYRTAVPLPPGALKPGAPVALLDAKRRPIPCQFTTLATWHPSDEGKDAPPELVKRTGVRWLGLDFTAPVVPRGQRFYLRYGDLPKDWAPPQPAHGLTVSETQDLITVDNGLIRFAVRRKGYNFIDSLFAGEKRLIESGSGKGAYATREDGAVCWSANDDKTDVRVEVSGPLLTVIRAEGWHKPDGAKPGDTGFCRYIVRIYAYADVPYIKVQHTWINTEDSKKTRFGAFGLFVPTGGPRREQTQAILVRDWERAELLQISQKDASVQRTSLGAETISGWFSINGIGMAVRDFTQNYPKETEFAPEGTWLHFWPRHNMATDRTPSKGNLWRLWFCHEGRLLDFGVPKSYDTPDLRPLVMFQGDGFAANAMGIAKTHEVLLCFGDAERDTQDYHRVFETSPTVTAGGEWNCKSGALGNMMWEDTTAFPAVEKWFHDGHEAYVAWRDRVHDWGMWTFGDVHHFYSQNAPTYYRMMAATHHGRPTAAWHLFFRSGKQTYLTQARRNTLHLIDVDHCHYVAPDYNRTRRTFADQKAVGGITGYYGYVHWHHGAGRGFDSIVDYMWFDYYMNGNRRALDVALEHGALVHRANHVTAERSGAAVQNVLMDMYMATWDRKYWDRFRKNIDVVTRFDPKQGITSSLNWMPWWRKYLDLCRDTRIQDFIIRFADQGPGKYFFTDMIAKAHELTGAPAYLEDMQQFFRQFAYSYYDPPKRDTWYPSQNGAGGCPGLVGYRMVWSFAIQKYPYAMRAVHDARVKPAFDPAKWQGRGATQSRRGKTGLRILMIVDNPDGRPIPVPERYFQPDPAWHSIIGPDGEIVALRREVGPGAASIPTAGNKPGLYAVYFGDQGSARLPDSVPGGVFVPEDDAGLMAWGLAHVYVPKGATRFVVYYGGHGNHAFPGTINIIDPSGTTRFHDAIPGSENSLHQRAELAVRPEESGKTWVVAGANSHIWRIEGIPECFTSAPEKMIDPDRLDPYLRRLRVSVLPDLRKQERKITEARIAAARAEIRDPHMNGVMEVLHYDRRERNNRRYGRFPHNLPSLEVRVFRDKYLEWKTRPVPAGALKADTYQFYWAGIMSRPPPGKDPRCFVLSIDSRDAVLFGPASEDKVWPGTVAGVTLKFEYRKHGDASPGIFRLTVPTKLVRAGEPVTLRVRGLTERAKISPYLYGNASDIWFGVYEASIRKPKK